MLRGKLGQIASLVLAPRVHGGAFFTPKSSSAPNSRQGLVTTNPQTLQNRKDAIIRYTGQFRYAFAMWCATGNAAIRKNRLLMIQRRSPMLQVVETIVRRSLLTLV